MKDLQRNKFTFTRSLLLLIEECPADERLSLVTAIVCYGLNKSTLQNIHGRSFELFLQAKIELDKSWRQYENGCSKPENHHYGGAPRGNHNASKTIPNQYPNNTTFQDHIYSNNQRENIIDKKEKKKEGADLLDFIDDSFLPPFRKWMQYRREIHKPYVADCSLKKCYNLLVNISNNNPKKADQIIDRSIANGWIGLFPLPNHSAKPQHISASETAMNTGVLLKDNSFDKYDNDKTW